MFTDHNNVHTATKSSCAARTITEERPSARVIEEKSCFNGGWCQRQMSRSGRQLNHISYYTFHCIKWF